MRRPAGQYFTRLLILDFFRHNLFAFILFIGIAAPLAVWFTNVPVATRSIEGQFVRWTLKSSKGPPSPWVFVDLPDSRTTAVKAWPGWQPPAIGAAIRLEEHTLLWFGRDYQLSVHPQVTATGDGTP